MKTLRSNVILLWLQRLFIIILFSSLLISCQGNIPINTPIPSPTLRPTSTTIPTPVPTDFFFPQSSEPVTDQMTAGLVGKLILEDGCPRVQGITGDSVLLYWPYNYSIDRNIDPAQIYDDTGQVVAHIGDYVEMGGGLPPTSTEEDKLPNGCVGPVWIVGQGPRVLDAFFPQLASVGPISTTTFLEGKLLLINGCLRLQVDENTSFLLIWPFGFSFNKEENPMQVYDGAGRVEAHVSEKIKVKGGELSYLKPPPGELTETVLVQALPKACSSGPYWIVDHIEK